MSSTCGLLIESERALRRPIAAFSSAVCPVAGASRALLLDVYVAYDQVR